MTISAENVSYITGRANAVQNSLPANVPFAITSNSGVGFSVADSVVTLEGNTSVDVFSIRVNGAEIPISWIDAESWQFEAPLQIGANSLTIEAFDYREVQIGSDAITITNTGTTTLPSVENTIISELHCHPADPSTAEIAAGFTDADDFEFVEGILIPVWRLI